jgi:Secretin and TonB N terminus short domain
MAVVVRAPQAAWVSNSRALFLLVGLAVPISAAVPHPSLATEQVVEFDIPAQPLDAALSAYGAATRTQLLFDPDITEGRRANGLKGNFTVEVALRRLLAGTGVAARAIGDEGFTLVREEATESPRNWSELSPTVQRFNAYSGAVQSAMRNALCQHEETAPGAYRVLARVWIGPSGAADRAELLTSSGDTHRDTTLAETLRGLAIGSSPPRDLPQPITLIVTSEGAGIGYCQAARRQSQEPEAVR